MLQKVDKDRLDKVLKIIELREMRKPNATLMREIPEKKGNVSAYLNGVKPMSDNFYKTFMDKFGLPDESILKQATTDDKITVLNSQMLVLAKEFARFREEITGNDALDYFATLVERMKAVLIEPSTGHKGAS